MLIDPTTAGPSSAAKPSCRKAVAILQSSYIPWKGYFDIIRAVDEFILYDEVQYTRRDWRNRNKIKGPLGPLWLSIPVRVKGRYHQRIDETEIEPTSWNTKHWQTIRHHYAKARFFRQYEDRLEQAFLQAVQSSLSLVNIHFLQTVCDILGINSKITRSTDYPSPGGRTERLVEICRLAGADSYGPSARDYIDESPFQREKIALHYVDYGGYPEYRQAHPPFEHHVSVIDLIFNEGPDAIQYMRRL